MQAIITKVLPATNTKPTRIKASCARGSLIYSVTHCKHEVGSAEAHAEAAGALCKQFVAEDEKTYGSHPARNPWGQPLVTGCLPSGDFAHVFTGSKTKYAGLVEALELLTSTCERLNDETAHPMHAHVAHVILSAKETIAAVKGGK